MKKITLVIIAFLAVLSAQSQTSSYRFIREGGQMSYIDTAETGVIEHTVFDDRVLPAKVALGFPFTFNGAVYDSLGISENGYIWFGPAQAEELAGITNPLTQALPASVKGVLCAFGIDLHPHINTSLTTTIRTRQVEHAGRINDFIVEWRNTSRYDAVNDAKGEDTLNFQMQFFPYENDRVQITYWSMGLNPDITSALSVGMKGASMSDFALRATTATNTWDNTVAGTDINSKCQLSVTSNPSKVPHNFMSWLSTATTGLNERVAGARVTLYPVPAKDILHIAPTSEYKVKSYEVIDVTGKVVKSGDASTLEIPVGDLKTGLYFLKLETTAGIVADRFVK